MGASFDKYVVTEVIHGLNFHAGKKRSGIYSNVLVAIIDEPDIASVKKALNGFINAYEQREPISFLRNNAQRLSFLQGNFYGIVEMLDAGEYDGPDMGGKYIGSESLAEFADWAFTEAAGDILRQIEAWGADL